MERSVTVYKEVEVDVYLSEIDTDDLIAELRSRDCQFIGGGGIDPVILDNLYEATVFGMKDKQQDLVKELVYQGIGRII